MDTFADKARNYLIYMLAAIGSLMYFNIMQAYQGNNTYYFGFFVALCLFDTGWYIRVFSNKILIFSGFFSRLRRILFVTICLNALMLAFNGPNQSWLIALILVIFVYYLEKLAVFNRFLAIEEKEKSIL